MKRVYTMYCLAILERVSRVLASPNSILEKVDAIENDGRNGGFGTGVK